VDQAPLGAVRVGDPGPHRCKHGRAGALFAARDGIGGISPADRVSFDPARYSLGGFFLAQPAVGVLGVLAITSEYQRVAVVGVVTALVGIAYSFAAFLVGVLSSGRPSAPPP
jgi:hypothetical protein